MGLYVRPNSPYYWMNLERPQQALLRESTKIPIRGGTAEQTKANRQLAHEAYAARMAELARARYLERPTFSTRRPRRPPTAGAPVVAPELRRRGWCHVYFVQRDHSVKIGHCQDIRKRMAQLQTAHSEPLVLLAVTVAHASLEDAFHHRFRDLRRVGEWFDLTTELRAYIDAVAAGLNPGALF